MTNDPIRVTPDPEHQAGAFTYYQWELAKPLIASLCLNGASFTDAVQTLVRLHNNPPNEELPPNP